MKTNKIQGKQTKQRRRSPHSKSTPVKVTSPEPTPAEYDHAIRILTQAARGIDKLEQNLCPCPKCRRDRERAARLNFP